MKAVLLLFLSSIFVVFAHYKGPPRLRVKRDVSGNLDIITNDAQPIHAEVKHENRRNDSVEVTTAAELHKDVITTAAATAAAVVSTAATTTKSPETTSEKPCPKYIPPSSIEMGAVYKVTPPKDIIYKGKSLRKSLPLTDKIDLIRSINRFITLIVLIIAGIIEFYPLIAHIVHLFNIL